MIFVDQNGEPKVIFHKCDNSRKGKQISKSELQKFGIELLIDLYQQQGMTIKDINRIDGFEFPQFVMESRNGKLYYVAVKTTTYPNDPFGLTKDDSNEIKRLAIQFEATPVFAGLAFANASSSDMTKVECGGAFIVSYKGLQQL